MKQINITQFLIICSYLFFNSYSTVGQTYQLDVSARNNYKLDYINALTFKIAPFAELELQPEGLLDTMKIENTSIEFGVAGIFAESISYHRFGHFIFSQAVEWNYVGPYVSVEYRSINFLDSTINKTLKITDYYSSKFTINGGIIAGHGDSDTWLPGITANLGVKYDFDNLYIRTGVGIEIARNIAIGINTYINVTNNNDYDSKYQKVSFSFRYMYWKD